MNKKPLVSIIIPVYNAENYIKNCISSILNQSYKNFEVILIDDGSTDYSKRLCEEYAKKDARIKLYHQENSGPSTARNLGLHLATGKYIQFVDADDSLENDAIEKLKVAVKPDVQLVICGYRKSSKTKNITEDVHPVISGTYRTEDFYKYFGVLYKDLSIVFPWNKLYLKEIINQFEIRFNPELKLGEDLLFNLDYLKHCRKINMISNECLYNYMIHKSENSLSSGIIEGFFRTQYMLISKVREFLISKQCYSDQNKLIIDNAYMSSVVSYTSAIIFGDLHISKRNRLNMIEKLVNNSYVESELNNIHYDSLQNWVMFNLIKRKLTRAIYLLLKLKSTIRSFLR
ncbi:glycosyltransferase family 2 protein [Sporolactobacillus sp. Y61]|uniref:Glycosyltransferase family 2 protein n=1 Tax=Sporolactobacillus sp. Y61 TaxID=3160863 RepID=A0AAU8IHR4_9BACL